MLDRIERIRQSFITRKTDQTDTHDHINRHDPDFQKNRHKNRNDWEDHDHDMTDISVESLIIFLEGLKKNNPDSDNQKNNPVDPKMKKAINAYGTPESRSEKRYTYLDDDDQDFDINKVNGLLQTLKSILDQGYDHITLAQADGFLDSIEKTVAKLQAL